MEAFPDAGLSPTVTDRHKRDAGGVAAAQHTRVARPRGGGWPPAVLRRLKTACPPEVRRLDHAVARVSFAQRTATHRRATRRPSPALAARAATSSRWPAHLARDAPVSPGKRTFSALRRTSNSPALPAAMPACRRSTRTPACVAERRRVSRRLPAWVPIADRPVWPARRARLCRPGARANAAALRHCRST